MIRGIIFDFGRVISAQKPLSLFQSYERDLGLEAGALNRLMFDSPEWRDALLGRKTIDEYWRTVGPRLGLQTSDQIENFRGRYHADERIDPQVLNLMERLFGKFKLAVCSNSPRGLVHWLADWNIDTLFAVIFCSGDEGVAKPDPAAYEITLERMGLEPAQAVFVDDTPENVEAAVACGLHGVHFSNGPALERELSHLLQQFR